MVFQSNVDEDWTTSIYSWLVNMFIHEVIHGGSENAGLTHESAMNGDIWWLNRGVDVQLG